MSTPTDPENQASSSAFTLGGEPAPAAPTVYDDHRRPLIRALKFGGIAVAVVTVLSLIGWGIAAGMPGVWGVLIGAAIGGGYVLLTALSVLVTANSSPTTTGAVLLGGWVFKLALVLFLFILLDPLTFYHRNAFVITLLVTMFISIFAELGGIMSTRSTFVTPEAKK